MLTTQLYFDEAYSGAVLAAGAYAEFGPPDTTHASDGIAGDPDADGSLIDLTPAETELGTGTLGLANIGVSSA